MQKSQIITPLAVSIPFATNGDKNIPNLNAAGTETSSLNLGFLPITQEQLPPDGNGVAPERTDFNGMFYLSTDLRVFLQNGGVITFDTNVATAIGGYPEDAILGYIDSSGNYGFVKSLHDDNSENFITTPSKINGTDWDWVYFNNFNLLLNLIEPYGKPLFTLINSLPNSNYIWLNGQEVSKTTFKTLWDVYGTTYNTGGESSGYFRLPDFGNRTLWGATDFGYVAAGLPNITGTAVSNGAHTHTMQSAGAHKHTQRTTKEDEGGAYITSGVSSSVTSNVSTSEAGAHTHTINSAGSHTHTLSLSATVEGQNIIGTTSTVRPPSIKVRFYTRWR